MNIFDHIDTLIPLITFSFAFGGAAFVFKALQKVIEKLEAKVESMESYYIRDMKHVMTKSMCEEETAHCIKSRDKVRDALEKKIDEIQALINVQDLKLHETNNKTHVFWLEIHEKLATIQANQESNKTMFSTHNAILTERSGHEERIVELEKIMKYRANNAIVSMPFGRRATDKKEKKR